MGSHAYCPLVVASVYMCSSMPPYMICMNIGVKARKTVKQ